MILGRHWAALCAALSYLYASISDLRFHLEFDPASMVAKKAPGASIDSSFMAKTQTTLLKPFRTYLRGVKALTIDGLINIDLYELVRQEVAQTPWDDIPTWLARLEEKSQLGKELQEQENLIEASITWTEILGELAWVPWDDHIKSYKPYELNGRCSDISLTCMFGEARCYLKYLYDRPEDRTEYWFETLESYASSTINSLGDRVRWSGYDDDVYDKFTSLEYRMATWEYRPPGVEYWSD
jgi:hypothetical protein